MEQTHRPGRDGVQRGTSQCEGVPASLRARARTIRFPARIGFSGGIPQWNAFFSGVFPLTCNFPRPIASAPSVVFAGGALLYWLRERKPV